jgi:hypothetical protein
VVPETANILPIKTAITILEARTSQITYFSLRDMTDYPIYVSKNFISRRFSELINTDIAL